MPLNSLCGCAAECRWRFTMRERVRILATTSRLHDKRGHFPMLNARGPIRTLAEVSEMTGLTREQVRYIEGNAFDKIRAALSAYGYHKERA